MIRSPIEFMRGRTFTDLPSDLVIKVPKKKVSDYKKLFKKAGLSKKIKVKN